MGFLNNLFNLALPPAIVMIPISATMLICILVPQFNILSRLASDDTPFQDDIYDFIIVGGGTAGCLLANRLSASPKIRVLLLDAGNEENMFTEIPALELYMQLTPMDWQYKSPPQENCCQGFKDKVCKLAQGMVIGGSSAINGMMYVRGAHKDYDNWEKLGNPGWAYKDVLQYFKEFEDITLPNLNTSYTGVGNELTISGARFENILGSAFLNAAAAINESQNPDYNGATQRGFAPLQGTQRRGARCSSSKAFLRPVLDRPNLRVSLRTNVTKITINNKTATGVEYRRLLKSGSYQTGIVRARKEVILSAGAFRSPHLLMLSGIGPAKHLEDFNISVVMDLPGVGQNMQDHVETPSVGFTIDKPLSVKMSRAYTVPNLLDWEINGKGPFTIFGSCQSIAFVNTPANNESDWADIQFYFIPATISFDNGEKVPDCFGFTDNLTTMYSPLKERDGFIIMPSVQRPRSRGTVRLASRDPMVYPEINPNYLSDPYDISTLVEGMKLAYKVGSDKAFAKFGAKVYNAAMPGCGDFDITNETYLACAARTFTMSGYHFSCTNKMGPRSDPMAVVDPNTLKVYGIDRLRVIDASVMPHIVSANLQASVFMVAQKGAKMIVNEWIKDFNISLKSPVKQSGLDTYSSAIANQISDLLKTFSVAINLNVG